MPGAGFSLTPRTWLIWGVATVAALWLAMTALGGITQYVRPGVALALYPRSGFAYENRAMAAATGEGESIQKMRVSDADVGDAVAALRREPFATSALTLLGIARDQRGDKEGATRLVAAAHALDKRQLVANAWLINRYGTTGRDREVLGLLDEALKIRPELSQQYMPAFAQALQNPETVSAFEVLLRNHPAWEKDFWQAVAGNDGALPNAEVLRGRILAGPENLGDVDQTLIAAFIRVGRLDLALSYAKSLPALPDDRDNLVRNSSFAEESVLPPLDWDLTSDGRVSAAIDQSLGTLELSALPGTGGVIARQLIAMQPGSYSLLVKLGQQALSAGSDITVRVACAEKGIAGASLDERLSGDTERPFVVPENPCRFYWLTIEFSALDSSTPALASIAEMRIARGRAAAADRPAAAPAAPSD